MAARLRLRRVRGVLGRGALTETLLAEVEAHGGAPPMVAVVKRLHPNLVDDRGAIARVAEEARVLARLQHPCIPAFVGVGDDDGLPFFAQSLIDGSPLPPDATLTWPEVVVLLGDVAGALAVAHDAGVVHRDVSRHNVLVDVAGRGWLVDFGVARADDRPRRTASGAVIGTPAAMSPEQARGDPATSAADLWAVGVLAMTWLGAGHPLALLDDDPPSTRLAKVRAGHLDDGALARLEQAAPSTLVALVRRCLAGQPGARPESGAALKAAIKALAATLDEAALRVGLGQRMTLAARPTAEATGETLDDDLTVTPTGRRPLHRVHPPGAARPDRRRR